MGSLQGSEGFISPPKNRRVIRRFHRNPGIPISGDRRFQKTASAVLPIVDPVESFVKSDRRFRNGEVLTVFVE